MKNNVQTIIMIILGFMIFQSFSNGLYAATLKVPSMYPTIQSGIDSAVNGDTVLVADGTYYCPDQNGISFNGKAITVMSEKTRFSCFVECNYDGRGFIFEHGETSSSVLQGFTIADGNVDGMDGGGILVKNGSSPLIRNCRVINSVAYWGRGGGAAVKDDSSPVFESCQFEENWADLIGGGMYIEDSSPSIRFCDFLTNTSESRVGGGIADSIASPVILGCRFLGNYGHDGGGIGNKFSEPLIQSTIFYSNSADLGGGVYDEGSESRIVNCTFAANDANFGSSVYEDSGSNSSAVNCIMYFGTSSEISGSLSVTYSDIQGGWPGGGNIDMDPAFAELWTGDLHITAPSPCLGAGSNAVSDLPTLDFEKDARVCYMLADMGADEAYPHLYNMFGVRPGGQFDIRAIGFPGAAYIHYFSTARLSVPYTTRYGDFFLAYPYTQFEQGNISSNATLATSYSTPTGWKAGDKYYIQSLLGITLSNLDSLEVR